MKLSHPPFFHMRVVSRRIRRSFLSQVAAAVLEVDVAKENVSAKEVEGIGLNAPKDSAEAMERAKVNLIYYRQNYVVALYASVLLAHIGNPLVAVAMLAGGAAAACASDTLLGEVSMMTDGKLVWNATRVAGLDRQTARLGLGGVGFVAAIAAAYYFAASLAVSLFWGLIMVTIHSVLRPIDLKSTLGNLWKDATGVKNREEAEAMVKKGVKGVQTWWKNRRPTDPTPVVVSVKDDPNNINPMGGGAGGGFGGERGGAANNDNRRGASGMGGDDGVVDTTGRVKPDAKGQLPWGRG